MTEVTTVLQTRNQLITNYDTSKSLLGNNHYQTADYTDSGAGSSLTELLVMGQIAATRKIVPLDPTAVDGSDKPVGLVVIAQDVTAGATVNVNIVNKGKVAEDKLTFKSGVTLDSVIDGQTLRARLNQLGLVLAGGTELTAYDNQ
jgi:hypothetical protein